jgi:cobalt-zinc-cadmium efflux system outer membrane protein
VDLPDAIARAMAHRPAVKAARLRVEQARRLRSASSARPAPRLDLGATSEPELRGNDDDLVLAQPLDVFGRSRAARALGDAQVSLAEAGLRQTLSEVQGEVFERYAEAVSASQLAANASAALQVAERLRELTRLRVEGRVAPAVQLTRVGIEVERARQNVALRQAQRDAALRRLGGAVGAEVGKVADYPVFLTTGSIDLATTRGDLMALAANVRVAEANVRVTRIAGRPELEASARTNVWTPGEKVTGIRLQLSLPVFDQGRIRNEVRAAELQAEAERRAFEDAKGRADAELEAVRGELQAAERQVESYQTLIAAARELVEKSEIGLREGAAAITLVEVLEAMRALREVEQGLVEARYRVAQAQAAYLKATGSLWEEKR